MWSAIKVRLCIGCLLKLPVLSTVQSSIILVNASDTRYLAEQRHSLSIYKVIIVTLGHTTYSSIVSRHVKSTYSIFSKMSNTGYILTHNSHSDKIWNFYGILCCPRPKMYHFIMYPVWKWMDAVTQSRVNIVFYSILHHVILQTYVQTWHFNVILTVCLDICTGSQIYFLLM